MLCPDTLSWLWVNQSLLILPNAMSWHIILILSQPVFTCTPWCYMYVLTRYPDSESTSFSSYSLMLCPDTLSWFWVNQSLLSYSLVLCSDTLSWFWVNQSLLVLPNAMSWYIILILNQPVSYSLILCPDTLSWFWVNQSLLVLPKAMSWHIILILSQPVLARTP
jgi:hypothetical protein